MTRPFGRSTQTRRHVPVGVLRGFAVITRVVVVALGSFLLLESGDYLLLESGDKIELE